MKPWFIAGIVALIVGFWTTADAQRDHRPRMGWKNMMLEKLDLTDEQSVKVRQGSDGYRESDGSAQGRRKDRENGA